MIALPEPQAFIRQNLRLQPVPSVPEICVYAAHPGSGLSGLVGHDAPPYWAYNWAGGSVLARYILDHPESVAGRRVIDLGTGSGIVAIAAMKSGAAGLTAVDVDPVAVIAARLNAEANGVAIDAICGDILDDAPPSADLILVGDLFYDASLAARVLPFLKRCRDANLGVLIGDPYRIPLPHDRLRELTRLSIVDFGDGPGGTGRIAAVFSLLD